jgi:hypothetical protein
VESEYVNSDGETVEPMVIYVFDQTINGVITYNGNYNLGPKHFAFSKVNKTTMLVADAHGRMYKVDESEFSKLQNQASITTHQFVLSPVKPQSLQNMKDEFFAQN